MFGEAAMQAPNKSVPNMLCKTKMCSFYRQGACSKGLACRFAHSPSELQQQPNLQNTQLCFAFKRNGVCLDGNSCKYAHGEQELRGSAHQQAPYPRPRQSPPMPVWCDPSEELYSSELFSMFDNQACNESILGHIIDREMREVKNMAGYGDRQHTVEHKPQEAWNTHAPELVCDDQEIPIWSRQTSAASNSQATTASAASNSQSGISDDGFSEELQGDGSPPDTDSDALDYHSQMQNMQSGHATQELMSSVRKMPSSVYSKTKVCKFFAKGLCARGASCTYAHELGEVEPKLDLFRTRLCFAFAKNGFCRDGDACKYAHGMDQLRTNDAQESPLGPLGDDANALQGVDNLRQVDALPMPVPRGPLPPTPSGASPVSAWKASAARNFKLGVKNTFLHVAPAESAARKSMTRRASCPTLWETQ